VLVVGGGPSGIAAAVAAAREGAHTTIIERNSCFGGNITQAMVESISWYRHENTIEAGGIQLELEKKAKEMGGTKKDPQSIGELLDIEVFKYVADQMIENEGIIPLLHCYVVGAITNGNTIKGVYTESKSGRTAILAKRVIDATGDADVAYHAGVPYQKASKEELQNVTINFACSGVNTERFLQHLEKHHGTVIDWSKETSGKENDHPLFWFDDVFKKAKKAGEIPENAYIKSWWSGGYTETGEVTNPNAVHIPGIDPTNVWDLTKAEMQGRHYAMLAMKALKKYMPGFEKARLRNFASSLGARESRKIIGAYNITESDVKNEARFEDSIGICPEFMDGYGLIILPTTGRYFQVPYGITLPLQVENLLVVGRCVAGDKISHTATRQMVCCTITGQGAGAAAAVSINGNVSCREADISEVQKALEKQGVRIK